MKRIAMGVILMLLGVICGASMVLAQLPTGTILGVVKDSSGGVVPDANVTVRNTDTNIARTTTTASDGSFRVPALQPGHYSVTVEKSGFNTQTRAGLELVVDQELPLPFTLSVGTSTQEITVTEEAPQVDTTTSSLGGLVNEDKISELPLNGRNFVDLATLQAGVTLDTNSTFTGTSGTGFSSNGAPVRSNNFTLDGAPLTNVRGVTAGAVGTTLGVDGIKEYKVITNAFTAEYGLNMGSQVVIVSKGGTNQWHGDVFEYLRNRNLDARNFFDHSEVTTGERLPMLQRNNFGASGGGPIQKDKTFFYAVFEGLRQRQGATTTDNDLAANCRTATANPCATSSGGVVNNAIVPFLSTNIYPLPNLPGTSKFFYAPVNPTQVNYGQIRVDHTFSDKDSMFGRYTTQQAYNSTGGAYPGLATTTEGRDQFLTVAENHIFNSNLLNTARASYSRAPIVTGVVAPAADFMAPYEYIQGQLMGNASIGGLTAYAPTANAPTVLIQNTYTLSDDVYWTKGRHAFKFGTLLNRIEYYTASVNYLRGTPSFTNVAAWLAGNYTQVVIETPGSVQARQVRFYTMGFYAQDDWRVTSRLTANLGLRYEPATVPLDRTGLNWTFIHVTDPTPVDAQPFRNATWKNISPRIGLAWDVRGNGKTSIRAAFGEYYDVNDAGFTFYTIGQGSPPTSSQITLPSGTITGLPFNIVGQPGTTIRSTQYNIDSPHMLQWNLTVEQQLTPSTALAVSYVGNRGIHLFDEVEGNPCEPQSVTNGVPYWGSGIAQCPAPDVRLNPSWGDNIITGTYADSYYHGLQATITKRLSHGLEVQGAYTWSHVLDDTQGLYFGSECTSGDGINIQSPYLDVPNALKTYNYGPSCFDVRHYLRVQTLYHLPTMKGGNAFLRGAANGWWVGNIVSWQTGYTISPMVNNWRSLNENMSQLSVLQSDHVNVGTVTQAGTGAASALTFIPYNPATVITGNPNQWFNPLMFTMNPIGYEGNAARGLLKGPHLGNVDFSANKDTRVPFLGEAGMVQFRAEFFNIFNHANFSLPNQLVFAGNLTDIGVTSEAPIATTAGQITATANQGRQIQMSLKLIF